VSGPSNRWNWELPSSEPNDPAWFRPGTSHWPRQPGRPASAPPRNGRSTPPDNDFRRTVAYTVAGTALPGLGLIAAKRRVAGWIILGLFLAVVSTLAVWAALDLQGLASVAVRPAVLRRLTVALILVALFWVAVVVTSHLSLRTRPTQAQRITGGVLVGALAFAVTAPMAVASRYS
jgi:polyisoprenyl-teichoic acid--peptidoglycan teichoic acid transferase